MATVQRTRLSSAVFQLPLERIRNGWHSDAYFNFTKELLEADDHHPQVLMQVFQKAEHSILGGIDEAIAILRECAGRRDDQGIWAPGWHDLEVCALYEGDEIGPHEAVLTIRGDYALFAHLETVYLGCMARRTLVMRNVHEVVEAANGKQILFFPARHDHWLVQTGDGWAAHVAGAIGVSTDAQACWWGGRGVGTVPHGLIAAYGGDTVLAARKFADRFGREMNVTVLVDFDQRQRPHGARRRRGARRPALGRAARHERVARRQGAGGHRALRRAAATGREGPHRARRARLQARPHRRQRGLHRRQDPPLRGSSACGSTPTGSAPRCFVARTTSRPMSSRSTASPSPRSDASAGPIRGWSA